MNRVLLVMVGAMFGYVTVCAGVVLFGLPSVHPVLPASWWRAHPDLVKVVAEFIAILPSVALAGYAFLCCLSAKF